MWFESWESLGVVIVKGLVAYVFIVFVLRITGKRTLSKMNAFDFIVTVALGSALASIILSPDVTLATGAVALALLVFLQYAVTWLSVRVPLFQRVIKAEPKLLFYNDLFLEDVMRKERVTPEELWAAVRSQGGADMTEVSCIVLETDGSLSVMRNSAESSESALRDVAR